MEPDEEQAQEIENTDELWAQSQADDATASVDAEGEESTEAETPTDDEPEASTVFDPEAFKQSIIEHFEKTVLPQQRDQWLHEAQQRARQSQDAREKRITERLAPVLELLKRQQAAGYITTEDAQAQLRETHQQIATQEDVQAKQQAEWDIRQKWLAQQPTPQTQPARVVDAEAWEKHFNQILQNSGLRDGDPELAHVPMELSDPDPQRALTLFQSAVVEAVKTKQQRIKSAPPRKQADLRTLPDMGVGAGAGGVNPLAGIEDMDELWRMTQM